MTTEYKTCNLMCLVWHVTHLKQHNLLKATNFSDQIKQHCATRTETVFLGIILPFMTLSLCHFWSWTRIHQMIYTAKYVIIKTTTAIKFPQKENEKEGATKSEVVTLWNLKAVFGTFSQISKKNKTKHIHQHILENGWGCYKPALIH